jgi:hypothetical protein
MDSLQNLAIYLLQILIQKTPRASHKLHQSAGKKNLPEVGRQEEIHTNTHAKVEPSKKQMRTLYKHYNCSNRKDLQTIVSKGDK